MGVHVEDLHGSSVLLPATGLPRPVAGRRELRELAARAQRVQAVGRALSWERALQEADDDERAPFADPVTGWLEVLVGRE
jgi:hypothetical protein